MQVIDNLSVEIDRRVNDLILGNLFSYLEDPLIPILQNSNSTLRFVYAGIIKEYVRCKRKHRKAVLNMLPMEYEALLAFMTMDKRKRDFREILEGRGISYKEIQKNLERYT